MTGWRLAVAIVLAFGGGWVLCSWQSLIRTEALLRANQSLRRAFAAQSDYIDYLEGGGDVVAEAENLLREPGP